MAGDTKVPFCWRWALIFAVAFRQSVVGCHAGRWLGCCRLSDAEATSVACCCHAIDPIQLTR